MEHKGLQDGTVTCAHQSCSFESSLAGGAVDGRQGWSAGTKCSPTLLIAHATDCCVGDCGSEGGNASMAVIVVQVRLAVDHVAGERGPMQ